MAFIQRILEKKLLNTAKMFSATYLSGARQCGKSTLVRHLSSLENVNYMTFDTATVRTAAKKDPGAFVDGLPNDKLNIIDEVQRVPAVYLLLKKKVDEKRFQGMGKTQSKAVDKALFLLTGSANIFALPKLAKAMVGRMAILTLYPFSTAEMHKSNINFIDRLWNEKLTVKNYKRANLVKIIQDSTFPEIALDKNIDRNAWFDAYLDTILERDAVEFANIRKPDLIYHLLAALSVRVGSLLNNDNVMSETGLNQGTYEKYKAFCNAAYLTFEIQPWAKPNKMNKRFVKSKKIYFTDTNFLCFLMRREITEVYKKDPSIMGHLFENFIAVEIMKAISSLPGKYYVSHFNPVRGDGKETDFVIEKDNGETIAVEVKIGASLNEKDFKNLELCRATIGSKFKRGIILYTGEELVPFADNLWAVPVNYLWE